MIRLDKAVQKIIEEEFGILLPRSFINKILLARAVRYNGEVIKKKGFKFDSFDEARKIEINKDIVKAVIEEYTTGKISQKYADMWHQSAPISSFEIREEYIKKAADIKDDVIFKNKNYLVVYKPPGVLSHPAQKDDADNMIYRFLKYVKQVDGFLPRGGLLHRLDKDTQGGIMFALNMMAFNHIKKQFNNQEVIKLYLACVTPYNPTTFGKKILGMAKKGDLQEFLNIYKQVDVSHTLEGIDTSEASALFKYILSRPSLDMVGYIAMYRFKNKARFSFDKRQLQKRIFRTIKDARSILYPLYWDQENNIALIAVRIITGRTHQIRAQLSSVGLPIIGDTIYTPGPILQKQQTKWNTKLFLHLLALGLSFYDLDSPDRTYVVVPRKKVKFVALEEVERSKTQ